jgi:hypothetical protein
MKYKVQVLLLFLFVSSKAFAHCPFDLEIEGEFFCADVEWLQAELKVGEGEFRKAFDKNSGSPVMSPQIIHMGVIGPKWLYSKAKVTIWKKGDQDHAPVLLDGLNVFPYMVMENGHHHDSAYEFKTSEEGDWYEVSKMPFHMMRGCWALRWSYGDGVSLSNSKLLLKVSNYQNSNEVENDFLDGFCEKLNGDSGHKPPHHGGHNNSHGQN